MGKKMETTIVFRVRDVGSMRPTGAQLRGVAE